MPVQGSLYGLLGHLAVGLGILPVAPVLVRPADADGSSLAEVEELTKAKTAVNERWKVPESSSESW